MFLENIAHVIHRLKILHWSPRSGLFKKQKKTKKKQTKKTKTNKTSILLLVNELLGPKNYIYKIAMLYLSYFLQKSNLKGDQLAIVLSLGHTRKRDHRIARLVTNLGDVRLVTTTKDQSLGFIYSLPLKLFGKNIFYDWL